MTQLLLSTKNKLRSRSGFTLVELITAMALLAIVGAMLVTICTGAISLIYRNSNKLDTVSGAKTGLNNVLSGGSGGSSSNETVIVKFGTGDTAPTVKVDGEIVEYTDSKEDGDITSKMEAFIPN